MIQLLPMDCGASYLWSIIYEMIMCSLTFN